MSDIKRIFNADKRVLLGGANEIATRLGIDVIFVRIAFAFSFLFIEWEPTLIAYLIVSAAFYFAARKEIPGLEKAERRLKRRQKVGSTHDLRTRLDTKDRRMMAIDHHLNSADSDKLAREIEELRGKVEAKKAAAAQASTEGEKK